MGNSASANGLSIKQKELRGRIDRCRATASKEKKRVDVQFIGEIGKGIGDFSKTSPVEKAFHAAYSVLDRSEDLAPEDDPRHERFVDPLHRRGPPVVDLCNVCGEPEHADSDLLQCFGHTEGLEGCGKFYHVSCVRRFQPPKGDWLCQRCANKARVNDEDGYGSSGCSVAGNEEEEADLDSDSERTTLGEKGNMEEGEDLTMDSDEDEQADSDSGDDDEDEEYKDDGGDEDKDEDDDFFSEEECSIKHGKVSNKKSKGSLKSKSKNSEDDLVDESSSAKKRKGSKNNTAASVAKKRKCTDDKLFEDSDDDEIQINNKIWKVRGAGEHPTTARQQQDNKVRLKIKSIRKGIETLQKQSLPYTRTDEYVPGDDKRLEMNQGHWPWVSHGACCLTNMAPNEDGRSEAQFLEKPVFQMWVGSTEAAEWVAEHFSKADNLPFKVKLHTEFHSYYDAFRSDSGKAKKAPPRPSKSTVEIVRL